MWKGFQHSSLRRTLTRPHQVAKMRRFQVRRFPLREERCRWSSRLGLRSCDLSPRDEKEVLIACRTRFQSHRPERRTAGRERCQTRTHVHLDPAALRRRELSQLKYVDAVASVHGDALMLAPSAGASLSDVTTGVGKPLTYMADSSRSPVALRFCETWAGLPSSPWMRASATSSAIAPSRASGSNPHWRIIRSR